MHVGEPSTEDYLRSLLEEISGLPDMFSSVNENVATTAIEGTLTMAGDSVDLDAVRGVAAKSGADVLPAENDVRRAVQAVLKKWWCSFGYNYVLSTIYAKHKRYLFIYNFCFDSVILTLLLLSLGYARKGRDDQGRAR
jgi:hypothetical protein